MADEAAGILVLGVLFGAVAVGKTLAEAFSTPPTGVMVGRKLTTLGSTRAVGLPELNRFKHTHVIGPTGSGKTTLLKNLIIADMRAGHGLAVIDPKGDLVEEVMEHVPVGRFNDVILFDPTDGEFPVGFNMLEAVAERERSRTASEVVSVFKKLFEDFWGPRLEHILRYTVLTLLEVPGSTLLDIPDVLANQDYREALLTNVDNFSVRQFWEQEYQEYSKRFRTEAISPILNKVGPWRAYPEVRNIVGQLHSSFNVRNLMDKRKILLVNIPQGVLGEDTSTLLGAMMVSKIQLAAMSRAGKPSHQRTPFFLYVDEFQNFVTSAFEKILTEARSFNLGLVVANQYPEQLTRALILALQKNVAVRLVCYKENEKHILLYQVLQDRKADDLLVKPLPPPVGGSKDLPRQIRFTCRQRYGRPRREVESDILGRHRRRQTPEDYYARYEEPEQDEWV